MQFERRMSMQDFMWALGSMCRLAHVPFSAQRARRVFAPPYSTARLRIAAVDLGLHVLASSVKKDGVLALGLPCLAFLNSKDSRDVGACSAAIVFEAEPDRVTFMEAGNDAVSHAVLADFSARWTGEVIRFQAASRDPIQAVGGEDRRFGFSWFIPELLRHRRIWGEVLLASLVIQVLMLAIPICTQIIIDKVVVHQTTSTLSVIGIALLAFVLFSAVMTWIRQYLVLHTGTRIDAVLGSYAFGHLLALPPRYFERRPTGTVVARLHGLEVIREFISGAAVALLLDLPFSIVFIAIMFWYSPSLALVVLAMLAAITVLSAVIVPPIRKRMQAQFLAGATNQAFLTEHVSAMETIKALQMEPQLRARYDSILARYLSAGFSARQLSNTYGVAAGFLEQLLTLAVLLLGAWMVMQNDGFTVGMLVAFQMFSSRLSQPVMRIAGLWQEFQQVAVAVQRLGDVMNAPVEPYAPASIQTQTKALTVEFVDVSFRHTENMPYVFRNFNLVLSPGTCTAVLGPSGSGKSTLARLLLGFYMPADGQVRINGRDARAMPVDDLRMSMGVVLQETVLFSGSIQQNLASADPAAELEDMVTACRLAGIHDFIDRLPEGYQTLVGEHGVGISGGQKQRLSIARALLRHPMLLIFDEAASNLDPENAMQLGRTITKLKGRMTILFIAHQLPSTLEADQVIVLEGGDS